MKTIITERLGLFSRERVRVSGPDIAAELVKLFGIPGPGAATALAMDSRAAATAAIEQIREFTTPLAKQRSENAQFARDALETIAEIERLGILRHRLASQVLLLGMDLSLHVRAIQSNINYLAAVQSRHKSDAGRRRASRANRKLTRAAYLAAGKKARNRTELAYLLQMSRQGLINWEKRNNVKAWKRAPKRQQRT